MMEDTVVFRRALLTDKEAVLAIDNIFDGADYLSCLYTIILQMKNTLSYLVEENGKVASFVFHHIYDGGRQMLEGGARTHEACRRKGYNRRLVEFAMQTTLKEYPQLEGRFFVNTLQSVADAVEANKHQQVRLVKKMKLLVYETSHSSLHSMSPSDMPVDKNRITTENVEEICFISNKENLFPEDVFKISGNWMPFPATDCNLKQAARYSHVVATKRQDGRCVAVSFGVTTQIQRYAFRYDVDLYIESGESKELRGPEQILQMSHIVLHAKHAASISKSGDKILILMTFPWDTNVHQLKENLRPHFGESSRSSYFTDNVCFIFEERFPSPFNANI